MSQSSLYDEDVLLWSERQAEILRDLARMRRDLPNDFDVDNVAEEIESVGRDQLQAVESFIRLIFVHAIKLLSVPTSDATRGWRAEMVRFHSEMLLRLTPSMPGKIDLARSWRRAKNEATDELAIWGDEVIGLPGECPVPLENLLAERLDIDRLLGSFVPEGNGKPAEH